MRKLLPRSSSNKSQGDEEEGEDGVALDADLPTGEATGEAGENNGEKGGDAQQEEPVPASSKSDNQTIMRFLGDKEKVSLRFFFLTS